MIRIMLSISAGEWEDIQHRPHHFMRRSAKSGWTVIYVEPPATLISPLKNRKMLTRWANWLKGLRQVEEKIYLLSPPPVLPFAYKYRYINKINQWLIAQSIRRQLKKHKMSLTSIDLYTFLPSAVDLLNLIKFDRVIYDCVDDHASFTGLINAKTVYKMEKELMEKADVSFATAKQLMNDREGWSNNFYLIPNGAEYEHFAVASEIKGYIPDDMDKINHPIVGYVGGIGDWIDISLLTRVAEQTKDVNFIIIGPVTTDVDALRILPNVRLLGAKRYQELPAYIRHFDTCIIPFKINKLTKSVNPIKLYEYLSTGKPIISTPLPEVLVFSHVVEIIHNDQEMIEAIKRTIRSDEKSEARIKERQQIGKENSWDARWELALKYIEAGQAREKKVNVTS